MTYLLCQSSNCGWSLNWVSWIPQHQTCERHLHIFQDWFYPLWPNMYPTRRKSFLIPSRQIRPCGLSSLVILLLFYTSFCFPYTRKVVTGNIQKKIYRKESRHPCSFLMSLYSQNVIFGTAQIYRLINATNIFLLHCSSCFTSSSWLRRISLGAQTPRSSYRDDLLGCLLCLCKRLPPIFLHQFPLSL